MKSNEIIGVVIGQDAERTLKLSLESLAGCNKIYYIDGGSRDRSLEIAKKYADEIQHCKFDASNPQMHSIQKNFMLEILKKNHLNSWAIYLDADELLDDNGLHIVKQHIENAKNIECYDIKMIHLIQDLAHEDATQQIHRTPRRIFKITEKLFYPKTEHTFLDGIQLENVGFIADTCLFHLAYCGGIWDVKRRFDGQMQRLKYNMHDENFLKMWRNAHLFGTYPKRPLDLTILPNLLLKEFGLSKDEIYFSNRGLEVKHFIMVKQWADYFKPSSVLDLGCGRGPYLYVWRWFADNCLGIEKSEWAVKNGFVDEIVCGDISDEKHYSFCDLITAIDVLEHLDDEQLDKTLKNMSKYGKKFLFSIPFKGDPNLLADKTHKQFMTKEEWIKKIESYGIKIKDAPKEWLYSHQLLIGEKNEK